MFSSLIDKTAHAYTKPFFTKVKSILYSTFPITHTAALAIAKLCV